MEWFDQNSYFTDFYTSCIENTVWNLIEICSKWLIVLKKNCKKYGKLILYNFLLVHSTRNFSDIDFKSFIIGSEYKIITVPL